MAELQARADSLDLSKVATDVYRTAVQCGPEGFEHSSAVSTGNVQ